MKKGRRNGYRERRGSSDLLREVKLGNEEEEVSLLIRMGSMAAVALVPAGGGTVDGLMEDAGAPMLAAEATCSALAGG